MSAAASGDGGGSSSSSSSSPPRSRLRQGLVVFLKSVGIWTPAALFWMSMVWGGPLFDLRTDEEIAEDEHEEQRLERFFGIDNVAEADYIAEWHAKEEALSQMVEKLLKSPRFMGMLKRGLDDDVTSIAEAAQASWSPSRKAGPAHQSVEAAALSIEVSYILPPVPSGDDQDGQMFSSPQDIRHTGGPRSWHPRLIIAHRSGAFALVMLTLEHVEKVKDRDERWTCTKLRAELLAGPGGECLGEALCDLVGPTPHGVRYMRI